MNLYRMLLEREAEGRPVQVGLIGAGKFASMYLAQALKTEGVHVNAVCDLDPNRARTALAATGWPADRIRATSFEDAARGRSVYVTDDAVALIEAPGIDVVIDATGDPAAGIRHALACIEARKHIIMVNVEADVLAGPLLAERARAAGVIYSMAYGDQPALIAELVDWARATGFEVTCAGKGTKYLPEYHASTPETVWGHYGLTPEQARSGGMNPKMFNSFLDGTKSSIEMAAVANATGLSAPDVGLAFPPCSVDALPEKLKPATAGGLLERSGTVEVVSSLERDGREIPHDLRWGVYVTFEAPSDYAARCFKEYGLVTDRSGRYSSLYRRYHLIGLELGISVASAVLRHEPTGQPRHFNADVVATAKRDLEAGERLDGEGGHTVWGRLIPAKASLDLGGLPIGLASGVRLKQRIRQGVSVRWRDVEFDESAQAVRVRRELEALHGSRQAA
ncbi:MAG TPA: Gfo/Idh/MocA family oxidoreductase [Gammaproteobacteria bacterium]|nr:Gfo/Idh/MocA family oxidoreductase [Gammaproteobacteria bacterium]